MCGGTAIAARGVFHSITVVPAWAGGSAGDDIKRGVALAMMIGVGNLGGVCSSFSYGTVDSPRFHLGHGTGVGRMVVSFGCAVVRGRNGSTDILGQALRIVHDDGYIQTD